MVIPFPRNDRPLDRNPDLLTILTPSSNQVNVRKYPTRGKVLKSPIIVLLETPELTSNKIVFCAPCGR